MNTETEPVVETASPIWRLKKNDDGQIFGPVDETVLKAWAESAQIAPQDLVDQSDEAWKPAPSIPILEMVWEVAMSPEQKYGPTTIGALREFLEEGLIHLQAEVRQVVTGETRLLATLLGLEAPSVARSPSPALREIEETDDLAPGENSQSGRIMVELAKEQRIRQLEEDLRTLRKEHEELLTKFRKLTQESGKGRAHIF